MAIQILLSLVFAFAVYTTWKRVRQNAVRSVEAVLWTLLWLAAAFVVWRPDTSTAMAHLFGIGRGADFIIYISIVLLFILVFQLYVAHDRTERNLTEIVRHEALRELDTDRKGQGESHKSAESEQTIIE